MARTESHSPQARTFALFAAVLIVAALYFCKEILLPLALAILFSFLLAPLVDRLERWGCHRVLSVLVAVSLCFATLGGLSYVLTRQLYDLAYNLPEYKVHIIEKARALKSDPDSTLGRAARALKEVQQNIAPTKSDGTAIRSPRPEADGETNSGERREPQRTGPDTGETKAASAQEEKIQLQVNEPVPVQVVDPLSVDKMLQTVLGPAVSFLGLSAMVVVFVIFILLEREDLRNRMIYLVGSGQLTQTTEVLDDAARRVSHYLVMQLVLNVTYGIVISIGLYLIGMPNALLWGAMTAILRFLPYIGPWLGAAMPVLVSLAVFDGWTRPILVVSLFVVNELISNNFLEPWLYGSSTGISSIGILVSAVFWTWLWGPLGLVMATPLTVCLTSLGRYVPELAFIRTLISTQEKLPAAMQFYQRLLAMDVEEANEITEEFLENHSRTELYDEVFMPALSLAEQDRHHGDLDELKAKAIYQTLRDLIDDFGSQASQNSPPSESAKSAGSKAPGDKRPSVLCVPARDEADEIAGLMLSQVVDTHGIELEVLPAATLAAEVLERISEQPIPLICVSALPPHAATHARYLCKRVRPRFPSIKIVVALWESGGSSTKARNRLTEVGVDKFVASLAEAADHLGALCSQAVVLAGTPESSSTPTVRPNSDKVQHPLEVS